MRLLLLFICISSPILAHPAKKPHSKQPYSPPKEAITLGRGEHRYQLVPQWGLGDSHPKIGHGHALVEDKQGRIYLANSSKKNCIVVFSPKGEILASWGDFCHTAHGLAISTEGDREVLFIADSEGHQVIKTTLTGEVLMTLHEPVESKLYEKREDFKPSKTLHLPNGEFYIIDGYGKDFVHKYDKEGTYLFSFGGTLGEGEAQLKHWGPHGGAIDFSNPESPTILLALSDQQKLKRFTLDGKHIETIPMKGGNPRDIIFHGNSVYIPHLGDAWPQDQSSPGIISVHDRKTLKKITTLGGGEEGYGHQAHAFLHPHGLLITKSGDLYLGQYASQNVYPLKFTHIQPE